MKREEFHFHAGAIVSRRVFSSGNDVGYLALWRSVHPSLQPNGFRYGDAFSLGRLLTAPRDAVCCGAMVANGTSRHFAAPQKSVAIGGIADIGRQGR